MGFFLEGKWTDGMVVNHAFGIDTNRDIFEDKVQSFSRSEIRRIYFVRVLLM